MRAPRRAGWLVVLTVCGATACAVLWSIAHAKRAPLADGCGAAALFVGLMAFVRWVWTSPDPNRGWNNTVSDVEFLCGGCGYPLRGLVQSEGVCTCPECGLAQHLPGDGSGIFHQSPGP